MWAGDYGDWLCKIALIRWSPEADGVTFNRVSTLRGLEVMHAGNTAFLANSENFEDFELAGLEYWRICDELTIVQAGLLIAGRDPSVDGEYIESWEPAKWPLGYAAAKTAISNALRRGTITGEVFPDYEYDFNGNACGEIRGSIDVRKSRVEVESLRTWLAGRGLKIGFFFPQPQVRQDYLDSKNPRYAPKLAAAVLAWEAIGGEAIMSGKSPKQLLMKWLREHAAEFALSDEDGKPNETGIEEAAKVANWQPTGGAPKTPG